MFILLYSTFTMTVLEVSCKTERKTEFRNPAEVNRKKKHFLTNFTIFWIFNWKNTSRVPLETDGRTVASYPSNTAAWIFFSSKYEAYVATAIKKNFTYFS